MTKFEVWVERYRRRFAWGQFLHRAADFLAAYAVAFGVVVLAVKLLFPAFAPHAVWLAVGFIPALLAAVWVAARESVRHDDAVALLDRRLGTGGLLMTLSELPDEQWEARLPQLEQAWQESLPRVRPKRFARFIALPAVFAIAACLVPPREARTAPVLRNTVAQQETGQLEDIMESLAETPALDEEEKQELEREIRELAEETKHTPLTHEKWETIDALRQRMQMRMENSAAGLTKAGNALAKMQEALENGEELSGDEIELLRKDVEQALQQLAAGKSLTQQQRDMLERLTKNGRLSLSSNPSERQQALDDLQDLLDKESERLSELRKKCQSGQCKSGQCQSCGGECDKEGNCKSGCNHPGRGGITRGRGDAELTWGDESDEAGVKFKETVLPPGAEEDPSEELLGFRQTAPEDEPAATAPRAGTRDAAAAAGAETWNRNIRPRHRQIVRQYFGNREESSAP